MKPYELKKLGSKPDERPDNNAAIRMCVNAWHELDADRQPTFGTPGAIAYTALLDWAEVNKLDHELFDLLREVIRRLDNDRALRLASEAKMKGKKR